MLSEHKQWLDNEYSQWTKALQESTIDNFQEHPMVLRMIGTVEEQLVKFNHYAKMVIEANPSSICEIGGGSGLFYITLRKLGYKGRYFIFDLPEVKEFQFKFAEYNGFPLQTDIRGDFDFCVSLYALGEFYDDLKKNYIENIVKHCKHGLIVWNPHSGANAEIPFDCNVQDEPIFTMEGNKLLTW